MDDISKIRAKEHILPIKMANTYFKFKQFTVFHDKCAMKVGTDGVLLGAWCGIKKASYVLDVGTGSGLISLMIAQRDPLACIMGIDVDEGAVAQACENFAASPFSRRLDVGHTSFLDLAHIATKKFDVIVCNPPFFSKSLLPPDTQRMQARHAVSLTLDQLFRNAKRILTSEGVFSLIVPFDKEAEIKEVSGKYGWYLLRKTVVFPTPTSPPKRILIECSASFVENSFEDSLMIEQTRHVYTDDFRTLVKDFYLHL